MSNGMYLQLSGVADHDDPFRRLEEKDVNVGDNDEESNLERLMQEKDVDTSLFTAINEVAEVLTQNQAEISALASVEKLEPSNYTYPQVSPTAVYPSPMQLVYLQPTEYGLSIVPLQQVAGQPSFIQQHLAGLHDNLQQLVVAQSGLPFKGPPHSVHDGLYSYNSSPYPSYESRNLLPHFMYDQSRMSQPLHTSHISLPYPVNGVGNPLPYQMPVPTPTNLASYPLFVPTNLTPYPPSPYTNLTPYTMSPPTNLMPYPQYGPIIQGRRIDTPQYFDHETKNNVVPVTCQDTAALTPTTTTAVQSTREKRFFRPWEGGGEREDCLQELREEDQTVQFGEEDFPALNEVFNKMKIKN